jgi:hypothetical protein
VSVGNWKILTRHDITGLVPRRRASLPAAASFDAGIFPIRKIKTRQANAGDNGKIAK